MCLLAVYDFERTTDCEFDFVNYTGTCLTFNIFKCIVYTKCTDQGAAEPKQNGNVRLADCGNRGDESCHVIYCIKT